MRQALDNAAVPGRLAVRGLEVTFATDDGPLTAVDGASFELELGVTLGLVGESGCGKTVTALAVLGLVPAPGRVTNGRVDFGGVDLLSLDEAALDRVRGNRISMIFQEPATALNPVYSVGEQIAEVLAVHRGAARRAAWQGAIAMLERVGIPDPASGARLYPHQMSGGMRQRAMIAMALACAPDILIADEPTTALDVTVQAQILDLIMEMQREMGMAVLFISHDLGVVSEIADRVLVMYAGRIVEQGPAAALFAAPLHPYTRALIETVPDWRRRRDRLASIPGTVPDPRALPPGCRFSPRCRLADDGCRLDEPSLEPVAGERAVACFKALP